VVKFSNFKCDTTDESKFRINLCRLRAVNRYRIDLNYNATLLIDHKTLFVHAQAFKKENGYKPWLFNTTVDVCKFFRKPYDPFFIIIFRSFKDHTNFNHTCPFKGDHIVNNIHLTYATLALPVPSGDYLINMNWYYDGELLCLQKFYFWVQE
ncbi:maker49, partial [Drosophila busckii]